MTFKYALMCEKSGNVTTKEGIAEIVFVEPFLGDYAISITPSEQATVFYSKKSESGFVVNAMNMDLKPLDIEVTWLCVPVYNE